MNVNELYEGWGWLKSLDFSGREMKTKYIPFAKRWINIHPKKRLIAKLQKEFPEIKPVDAERAYRLAYEKYSDNRDKGFAAMREEYKKGSAGQLKGKDAITKKSKPGGNETPHPARGKLVGEDDTARLSAAIGSLGLDNDDPYMLIARGLQKSVGGEGLSIRERNALKPYVGLFTKLLTTPQFRSNMLAMNKILKGKGKGHSNVEKDKQSKGS